MNEEHPDERALLHIAFPETYPGEEECRVLHVLSCPQCMEAVLALREMAELLPQLRGKSHRAGGGRGSADPAVGHAGSAEYALPGQGGDFVPAAALNDKSSGVEAYLDLDSVGYWDNLNIACDGAEDGEASPEVDYGENDGAE